MTRTRDYIPALDGLRGVAVLMVMWAHLGHQIALPMAQHGAGGFGVDLFFVLSGFLITRILLFNRENDVSVWRFLKRRCLRIWPAFYLMLLLFFLWYGWSDFLFHAMTYTYNFYPPMHGGLGHTWSLCVEEHFYLVWPIIVMFIPVWGSKRLAVIGILASLIGGVAFEAWAVRSSQGEWVRHALSMWTPFRAGSLLLGSLIAYFEIYIRGRVLGLRLGIAAIIAAIVGIEALEAFGWYFGLGTQQSAATVWSALIAAGILLIVLSRQVRPVEDTLTYGKLKYVGKISYGLYLFHYPIYCTILVTTWHPGTSLIKVVSAVGLSVLVASTSYKYFERPILDGRWPWQHHVTQPSYIGSVAS